jgi:hypothetical protein
MLSAQGGKPCANSELPELLSGMTMGEGLDVRPATITSRQASVSQPEWKLPRLQAQGHVWRQQQARK